VNIERRKDGKIEMTQPTLTRSILKDVGLWEHGKKNQATSRTTPACSTTIQELRIEKSLFSQPELTIAGN